MPSPVIVVLANHACGACEPRPVRHIKSWRDRDSCPTRADAGSVGAIRHTHDLLLRTVIHSPDGCSIGPSKSAAAFIHASIRSTAVPDRSRIARRIYLIEYYQAADMKIRKTSHGRCRRAAVRERDRICSLAVSRFVQLQTFCSPLALLLLPPIQTNPQHHHRTSLGR